MNGGAFGSFKYGPDGRVYESNVNLTLVQRPAPDFEWDKNAGRARTHIVLAGQVIATQEEDFTPPTGGPTCGSAGAGWAFDADGPAPPPVLVLFVYGSLPLMVLCGRRIGGSLGARGTVAVGTTTVFVVAVSVPLGLLRGASAAAPDSVRFYHRDHLGSVFLTTFGDGSPAERVVYRPFGEPVPSSATVGEFGFTGQRSETNLGIYNYGARWYDPGVGLFLQTDPVVVASSQALPAYGYVGNNPINRTDPTGAISEGLPIDTGFGRAHDLFGLQIDESIRLTQKAMHRIAKEQAKFAEEMQALLAQNRGVATPRSSQGVDAGSLPSGSGFPGDPLDNRTANALAGGSMPGDSAGNASGGSLFRSLLVGLGKTLGAIWASPTTAIGLVIGAVGLLGGASVGFENGGIAFRSFPFGPNGALTLGNAQIYRNSAPGDTGRFYGVFQNLGAHEYAHTLQAYVFGPLFLPAYVAGGRIASGSNAFERAATAYATGRGSFLP